MSKLYFILENGQPMDGEFYDRDEVVGAVLNADTGARVLCIDTETLTTTDETISVGHDAYHLHAGEYDEFRHMPEILQSVGDHDEWYAEREAWRDFA